VINELNSLSINNTLTIIDLSGNNIGDKGVEFLSNALSVNNTLTGIDLSYNNIGDKGVEYLSNALSINYTLTIINLVIVMLVMKDLNIYQMLYLLIIH
jgi:Ran GTPase-activating protein (RanGAP) involved in mRNA processing and transport